MSPRFTIRRFNDRAHCWKRQVQIFRGEALKISQADAGKKRYSALSPKTQQVDSLHSCINALSQAKLHEVEAERDLHKEAADTVKKESDELKVKLQKVTGLNVLM